MKISSDTKEFKIINKVVGGSAESLSERIIKVFIEHWGLTDKKDYYGYSVADYIYDNNFSPNDVLFSCFPEFQKEPHIILANGYEFGRLILIGDGDCSECGNDMDDSDGEYEEISNGNDVPPSFEPIELEKTCSLCGHSERKYYRNGSIED